MKASGLLTTAVTFLLAALASAGPAILYVSESGEKRIATKTLTSANFL